MSTKAIIIIAIVGFILGTIVAAAPMYVLYYSFNSGLDAISTSLNVLTN